MYTLRCTGMQNQTLATVKDCVGSAINFINDHQPKAMRIKNRLDEVVLELLQIKEGEPTVVKGGGITVVITKRIKQGNK